MKIGIESIMIRYSRDRTAKLVVRFEVRLLFSRGYYLKCSHLAIAARMHCPKGDQINESLLYLAAHVHQA